MLLVTLESVLAALVVVLVYFLTVELLPWLEP